MAGSKSDFYENKVIEHLFETAYTAPDPLYVALYTAPPTDSTAGTEVSGGAYARESVAQGTGWTSSGNATENAADITFQNLFCIHHCLLWGAVCAATILKP